MGLDALGLPGAQGVALRRLDLDHLGAEIAEDLRQDVAGEQAAGSLMLAAFAAADCGSLTCCCSSAF